MWLTFNRIDADILIDCRDLENNRDIMPTYKLAKELNITKKLVFHIDKLFFGFFFLRNLSYFKSNAVIYTDKEVFYLTRNKINESLKIEDIVLGDLNKEIRLDWLVSNFINIKDGRGGIKLEEGYIIVKK